MRHVFQYTDYRDFLADFYTAKKATQPGFSHRSFLASAGLKGPNFLKNVIDGKRNISAATAGKFAHAMQLGKRETEYFCCLVQFNQSRTAKKKQMFFDRLSRSTHSRLAQLNSDQLEYYSKWYNVAIREYIHCRGFDGDFESLAKGIYPHITPRQAQAAVALLEKLQMIRRRKDGAYELSDTMVTTGPEVQSMWVRNFHRSMIDISKEALDYFPQNQRSLRAITASCSEHTYQEIRLELDRVRKRILELIDRDGKPSKVCQVNLHLFPLVPRTRRGPKGRNDA